MDCDTRDMLEAMYRPYNTELYLQLQRDNAMGLNPPEEPAFIKFDLCKCNQGGELQEAKGKHEEEQARTEEDQEWNQGGVYLMCKY